MRKKYIYPTLEILPFCAVLSLCQSGGGSEPGKIDGGGDPGEGRAPERVVF